jgi:hypothetical protein
MGALMNMQDAKGWGKNMMIVQLLEKSVSGARRGKPKEKRTIFELEYEDGSRVVMLWLDGRILAAGGVECVAYPQYCGGCYSVTSHDFYHVNNGSIRCRFCGNVLGENDNRPLAKVLDFPRPHEK